MRCTTYAQISGLAQKANVISESPQWGNNSKVKKKQLALSTLVFQSPQWGNNSKVYHGALRAYDVSFSPRNGEIILKFIGLNWSSTESFTFQSPQWGNNSKGEAYNGGKALHSFQSPQWGNNSKVGERYCRL